MTLTEALSPQRFTSMSRKMAAIVGCILGADFTDPTLAELCITADGFLLGRRSDDCGFNEWIGSASDLERNWRGLLEAAGLTAAQEAEADRLYQARVMDWRDVSIT